MKILYYKLLPILSCILLIFMLLGCNGDEPDSPSKPSSSKEVNPVIKIITDASTTNDFIVSFRVKSVSKPKVTLSWGVYNSKTTSPKYTKSSSVTKTYDIVKYKTSDASEYFYKVQHAGFSPGNYVYYKIEASNSKGKDSATGYVIIKR